MTPKVQSARVFSPQQVLLPEISYKSFTYPGDEEALAALKAIPGAAPLLTYLQENFTEQYMFVKNNEQMIRASHHSFQSLHSLVQRCCEVLSCPVPELYVTTNPVLNAYTMGQRRTCIVLHSSLVETLTLDELSFVIGHELGHIKCAHGLYRLLGDILLRYWDAVSSVIPIPGVGLLRVPLLLAYWEWYRRAEFTCDRAGLLCVQDVDAGLRALGKLAGNIRGYEDEFNIETAITQAQALKEVNKLVQVIAILERADDTHPFVPRRLKLLREYAQDEAYQRILSGDYQRDPLGLHEGGERIRCKCGTIVNSKLAFCPECGTPIKSDDATVACPGCAIELPKDTKFCPKCGAKQPGADQAAAAAATPTLDKWKNTASSFFKR